MEALPSAMAVRRRDAGGVWDLEDGEAPLAARALIERDSELAAGLAGPLLRG